jgi:hypothetical protein
VEDLKAVAWMVRYAARSLAHNLRFIPQDRASWKPDSAAGNPTGREGSIRGVDNRWQGCQDDLVALPCPPSYGRTSGECRVSPVEDRKRMSELGKRIGKQPSLPPTAQAVPDRPAA